jgi:hypothetical protein
MNSRKFYRWIRVGSLILFLTFASVFAFGDRLILASHVGGKYDYEYSTPLVGIDWRFGQGFKLSGVTGATVSGPLAKCLSASFTASSVTVTDPNLFNACEILVVPPIGTLEVSSLAPEGDVFYVVKATFGNNEGFVGGPVGPVPEPSSLLLLGSGVLGLAAMIRRKITT